MGSILAGSQNPIDGFRRGIIPANGFRPFSRKPGFSAYERQAMRATQGSESDRRERLLVNQIDQRKRVDERQGVLSWNCLGGP